MVRRWLAVRFAEKLKNEKRIKKRLEEERMRVERERLEKEKQRLMKESQEKERLEKERLRLLEQENLKKEKERLEQERLKKEKERLEREKGKERNQMEQDLLELEKMLLDQEKELKIEKIIQTDLPFQGNDRKNGRSFALFDPRVPSKTNLIDEQSAMLLNSPRIVQNFARDAANTPRKLQFGLNAELVRRIHVKSHVTPLHSSRESIPSVNSLPRCSLEASRGSISAMNSLPRRSLEAEVAKFLPKPPAPAPSQESCDSLDLDQLISPLEIDMYPFIVFARDHFRTIPLEKRGEKRREISWDVRTSFSNKGIVCPLLPHPSASFENLAMEAFQLILQYMTDPRDTASHSSDTPSHSSDETSQLFDDIPLKSLRAVQRIIEIGFV